MKNKKGFTLIELIAVLVILAIILLISVPIVIGIVKKTQLSANKRSVDYYGKSIELAIASYLLDNGKYPNEIEDLDIKYKGNKIVCDQMELDEEKKVFLSKCIVEGMKVLDNKTSDGWYHYGKSKNEEIVEADAEDSETLRDESYTEVKEHDYEVGDLVKYNNMNFYVLTASNTEDNYVTLLKAEPLTYDEIYPYFENTDMASKIFKYQDNSESNSDEYLRMGYFYVGGHYNGYGQTGAMNGNTCGYTDYFNYLFTGGCKNDFKESDIKVVLDKWAENRINSNDLVSNSYKYSVRLITKYEYLSNCDVEDSINDSGKEYEKVTPQYEWLRIINDHYQGEYYEYWTMTPLGDSPKKVYYITSYGDLNGIESYWQYALVRPVITIKKSVAVKE